MKKFFSAAMAVLVMAAGLFSSPAVARDNSRVWNLDPESAQVALSEGKRVCYGDEQKKKQSDCMVWNRFTNMLLVSSVIRVDGIGKNAGVAMGFATDGVGQPIRDASGAPKMLFAHVSESSNGPAIVTQGLANIPAAMLNGVGAAAINAAFPACSGNCGGGGSVSYAISGSEANSFLQAALQGGGCTTGTCGSTTPTNPNHTQNGPGN